MDYDFIDQAQEDRDYEFGAQFGDPRRCPIHGVAISSPDGMFDGLCHRCEGDASANDTEAYGLAKDGEATVWFCPEGDRVEVFRAGGSPTVLSRPHARDLYRFLRTEGFAALPR